MFSLNAIDLRFFFVFFSLLFIDIVVCCLGDGGMGGSRGHSKIEDLWRRMWGVHDEGVEEEKKCRGVGDGADEPG